ncbi:MAG TPA: hypothetical protein DCQ64_15525 [Candidatus Rokubacteria bacterium]|nr:hypothetical protein [Candidatus Rokubacteria bacterium]
MAFWRVKAFAVFDTAAHRDAARAAVEARGGSATPGTDEEERPTLRADMDLARDEAKARNIRGALRAAHLAGRIVAGTFTLHRCTHDEGPAAWRDCKTLSYEVG